MPGMAECGAAVTQQEAMRPGTGQARPIALGKWDIFKPVERATSPHSLLLALGRTQPDPRYERLLLILFGLFRFISRVDFAQFIQIFA